MQGAHLDEHLGPALELRWKDRAPVLRRLGPRRVPLRWMAPGCLADADGGTQLRFRHDGAVPRRSLILDGGHLVIKTARLPAFEPGLPPGLVGSYRSTELDAEVEVSAHEGALAECFRGPLGQQPAWPLRRVGRDVRIMSCDRALDAAALGDFALWFQRALGPDAAADHLNVSCLLARHAVFRRLAAGPA